MSKPTVYLAGPITGLSFDRATDWRQTAKAYFEDKGIDALSPLRGKSYLDKELNIKDSYEDLPLSSARGIYTRDRFDCNRADVVLINLLGATKVSIGTVMEIAWADAAGKPIVLIIDTTGNVHDHAMVREAAGFRVNNLDEALFIVNVLLNK